MYLQNLASLDFANYTLRKPNSILAKKTHCSNLHTIAESIIFFSFCKIETGNGKRTKRFAHLKQKILNKKAAKWEKIEAKKAAKWAKINAKKQGGLVVDTHVDFVDVCREVPQERCVENPIERCHNEPIQDCKKVAKQNCVTAEKVKNYSNIFI